MFKRFSYFFTYSGRFYKVYNVLYFVLLFLSFLSLFIPSFSVIFFFSVILLMFLSFIKSRLLKPLFTCFLSYKSFSSAEFDIVYSE